MDLRDGTFNSAQKWTVICIEYWIQRTYIIESVVTPYMQDKIWVSNSAVLASGCAWVELSTGIVCVGVCAGVIVPADSPCDICTVYLPTLSQYYFLIRLSRLNNACNVTGRNLCMEAVRGVGRLINARIANDPAAYDCSVCLLATKACLPSSYSIRYYLLWLHPANLVWSPSYDATM